MQTKRIALFASGTGSNCIKIHRHFQNIDAVDIVLIVSNKKDAGILNNPEVKDIPKRVVSRKDFYETNSFVDEMTALNLDLIVLAGFLWKIPEHLIVTFPNKIINIHPALLPKYGGKGMYGKHVHQAVFDAKEKESGMTVHFVNEYYDEGKHIFQATCDVSDVKSPDEIAKRVLRIEHKYYPQVIEEVLFKTFFENHITKSAVNRLR